MNKYLNTDEAAEIVRTAFRNLTTEQAYRALRRIASENAEIWLGAYGSLLFSHYEHSTVPMFIRQEADL